MTKIIINIGLCLLCVQAQAQLAVTNSGNMQINTGASVAGFGNFTNTSTGALVNNGNLYLKNGVVNDQASMATGSGSLYLNGSSAQVVSGSQTFKTYNLITNNASGITLSNNLSVKNLHTFSTGVITTSATPNYLIYESGSSYTGNNDSRHVNGWVKKIGNTDFIFPVGNGSMQRTVALNNMTAASEFNARYATSTPNTAQMQMPLFGLDAAEYWMINRVSGGSATVVMNWDNSKVPFPSWLMNEVAAASYTGSDWADMGGTVTGNLATTGEVRSNTVTAFNAFTFGRSAGAFALMLVNFSAKRQSDYSEITWVTSNEHEVDHFEVQRSDDNINFYTIAQTPGRNTSVMQRYLMKDYKPMGRIAYYRLRYIDTDKQETYSKIVSVTSEVASANLTLLTNPVQSKVTLMADGNISGMYSYVIANVGGQVLQSGNLPVQSAGKYDVVLNGRPAAGTYVITLKNQEHAYSFKFTIE